MEPTASPSSASSSRASSALVLGGALTAALLAAVAQSAVQTSPPETPATTMIVDPGSAQRVAIPDCVPKRADEASREACKTITQVLRADLKFEGLFRFVPEELMSAIKALDPEHPDFTDWRGIGATYLVTTQAIVNGPDLQVEAKVYAPESGQTILSRRYSGKADNPRSYAHQASDEVVALTGFRGVARTKIAFVSNRDAPAKGRQSKELYVMDYDGFNPRRVTVNKSLNILPNWNPDGRSLSYVSYRQGQPDVYVASIYEGRSANLTNGRGQSFAPSFSPDGKHIAYSSNRGGNMDVWVANADGSGARKLTDSAALDTAPTWSPTGQEIAFTSDRGGTPQIYIMDSEGLNVRRLTTVGNWNDAPSWNPSKQFSELAYTSRIEGGFEIAVIDLASRQVRQVTLGRGSCEYPSWAPSGRHLVFSCGRGRSWQVTVSDRLGQTVQTLTGGSNKNEQPDWGP
jgi:TolB protein